MMGQFPIKVSNLPSRLSFAQPVRWDWLTAQSNGNQFLIYISRPPSSQHNMQHLGLFKYVIAFPAATGSQLGSLVWNRIKDIYNKIYNQNCHPPSCGTDHILIRLSTLGTSIRIIYNCWDITHSFKMPVFLQKIKVDHSWSHLAVFSLDITAMVFRY